MESVDCRAHKKRGGEKDRLLSLLFHQGITQLEVRFPAECSVTSSDSAEFRSFHSCPGAQLGLSSWSKRAIIR
jgi:hypothetical protein